MKIRAMYVMMLVLAIGLLGYSAPAIAEHGSSNFVNDGHWDNWTVNDTDNVGLKGYLFIPAFLRIDCDERAIHGPPAGFTKSDGVFADGQTKLTNAELTGKRLFPNEAGSSAKGGCTNHAWEILSAWASGGFFDPRGGTDFIPPSGDHHRSGARALLRMPFSGGSWLTGFAPALGSFPNFNMTGLRGAGEAPEAVFEYCEVAKVPANHDEAERLGILHYADFTLVPDVTGSTGPDGFGGGPDTSVDCSDVAAIAGAAILAFVDHHGEPLTPGRFPRYIPHERQGWPSTVVTKYTASSQNQGHGISQLFETSAKFLDGADSTEVVSWFSMSDESAGGCGDSPWCEWLYDPVSHTLCKREGGAAGVRTMGVDNGVCKGIDSDGVTLIIDAGAITVTTVTVIDDINAGTDGVVEVVHTMRKFEKAPVVIYQKLGQFVEMDTDAATPNSEFTPSTIRGDRGTGFTHNEGSGDIEQSGQAVWYEFWGLSGPNFQAEEGHDPYTWVICGDRGTDTGEENCNLGGSGLKDSPSVQAIGGATGAGFWAIVKPPSRSENKVDLGGLDVFRRYGDDLRPTTGESCDEAGQGVDNDPSICGSTGVVVLCTPGGASLVENPTTLINESNIVTDNCKSEAGADGVYGTGDDGTIYFREAGENKLRAFTRENRAHSFSFINGIGVNHPDLCGERTVTSIDTDDSGSPDTFGLTTECGDSPSTGTRQVMYQNIQDLGATLSCFNCSQLGQHTVPDHGFDRYSFKWTPLPGVHIPEDHPNTNGTIPEGNTSGLGFE